MEPGAKVQNEIMFLESQIADIDLSHSVQVVKANPEDHELENENTKPNFNDLNVMDFSPPDDFLAEKIVKQVEHFFSDFNILKDKFLMKHIRRNREGYVSLKLISSLRKIKALTKDWRVVAYSLQKSKKLQINEEKTKIRRIDPLPEFKPSSPESMVLIFNVPENHNTVEGIKSLLQKFGKVVNVSVMSSKPDLTNSFFQRILLENPNVSFASTYAVAQFETTEQALAAGHSSDDSICIMPFVKSGASGKQSSPTLQSSESQKSSSPPVPLSEKSSGNNSAENGRVKFQEPRYLTSKNIVIRQDDGVYRPRKYQGLARRSMAYNTAEVELNDTESMLPCSYRGDGFANNSWRKRRFLIGNYNRYFNNGEVVIIRQPRGPDGTIGFHEGRMKAGLYVAQGMNYIF